MKVTLNNIGKKYENREDFTLRHINLEIEDKDFCVILGPSLDQIRKCNLWPRCMGHLM